MPRQQRRMIGEIRERLVVERGEAVAEQRGRTIGDDRDHQILARDPAAKDRAAPQFRRQRNGYQIDRSLVGRGGAAVPQRFANRPQKRVRLHPRALRQAVGKTRDFENEPAAVRNRIDIRARARARRSRPAAAPRLKLQRPRQDEAEKPLQSSCTTARATDASQGAHYRHGIRQLHSQRHHRSRRAGPSPQAPRDVHRRRRLDRPASPRLGSARQRRRRGDERLRFKHLGDATRRWIVDHGRRRWARDSGRQTSHVEDECARSHFHGPARRREVRARQLQDRRRPARRRGERGQRAVERTDSHCQARRGAVGDALQAGQAGRPAEEARRGARQRHQRVLPPGRRDLPENRIRPGDHQGAARGRQLPAQGPEGHRSRTKRRRRSRSSSTAKGWSTT